MACRVGMSHDPQSRIDYWKAVEGHTYSSILASGLTYDGALAREKSEAQTRGCKYGPGGERKAGRVYSVYYLSGGR